MGHKETNFRIFSKTTVPEALVKISETLESIDSNLSKLVKEIRKMGVLIGKGK